MAKPQRKDISLGEYAHHQQRLEKRISELRKVPKDELLAMAKQKSRLQTGLHAGTPTDEVRHHILNSEGLFHHQGAPNSDAMHKAYMQTPLHQRKTMGEEYAKGAPKDLTPLKPDTAMEKKDAEGKAASEAEAKSIRAKTASDFARDSKSSKDHERAYDAHIEAGHSTLDPAARKEHFRAADEHLREADKAGKREKYEAAANEAEVASKKARESGTHEDHAAAARAHSNAQWRATMGGADDATAERHGALGTEHAKSAKAAKSTSPLTPAEKLAAEKSQHAMELSEKAKKTGAPEDHKAALVAHAVAQGHHAATGFGASAAEMHRKMGEAHAEAAGSKVGGPAPVVAPPAGGEEGAHKAATRSANAMTKALKAGGEGSHEEAANAHAEAAKHHRARAAELRGQGLNLKSNPHLASAAVHERHAEHHRQQHVLQQGKKGGTFYVGEGGQKHYVGHK